MLTAILVFVKRNKAVVGSRNEGVSNYAGGGCDMRDTILFFQL